MDTQGYGLSETHILSKTCECNIPTIKDNEEFCEKCGVCIVFDEVKCLKTSVILKPVVKTA
jgi:hypothetical protein